MNILLTNDDGVHSAGIQKLALALRSRGGHRVFVVAPDSDRSGVSHGISVMNGPAKLVSAGEDAWACSGLPADCVIVSLLGALPVKPDLVVSGINRGANLGTDLLYSGTAAAARQASLMGVPALALSLAGHDGFHWDMAASWSADNLEKLLAFWREETFVNVNIPNIPAGPEGLELAWPAVIARNDTFKMMDAPDGSRYCFIVPGKESAGPGACTDIDVVSRGRVSVSPVYIHPAVRKDLCPGAPDHAAVAPRGGKQGAGDD